jgi:hypothetical protein
MADDATTTTTTTAATDATTTATTTQTAASQVLNGTGDKGAATTPDFISRVPENARDYVNNKGWKSEADMLTSYQKLESAMGADKVVLPKEGDAESLKAFRAKMGVPESADKYDIKLPDGADVSKEFLGAAKNWFHEHNVSAKDAQGIVDKYNAWVGEQMKGVAGSKLKASTDGLAEIEKEWGKDTDAKKAAAQRAFKTFKAEAGLDQGDLDAMEEAIGTPKLMKLFASIGSGLAEARFVAGDTGATGNHFTPEAARARLTQMNADPDFRAKIIAGNPQAIAERKAVIEAAAAAQDAA